ncbi:hypothetical protein Q5P01_003180 [Channa striata]|uniref:Uncharacterized protein n=1 Tax=Channa striata TaxID=64152 RepID=A0AA88NS36_CHASR|nr:hypothetical protein Q5P01_003180 [Channa striata]
MDHLPGQALERGHILQAPPSMREQPGLLSSPTWLRAPSPTPRKRHPVVCSPQQAARPGAGTQDGEVEGRTDGGAG